MRSALLVLLLFAWVFSCFDAVSYVRARENEQIAQTGVAKATDALATRETAAESDNDLVQQKLEKEQIAIQTDQAMLQAAKRTGKNAAREQQLLTADQTKLQADRIVEGNTQDYTRANPDPQVAAARENVEIYQKQEAVWHATRERDITLSHGLAALWLAIIGLGFWTLQSRPAAPPLRPHDPALR